MKKLLALLALFIFNANQSNGQAFSWLQKAPIPGIPSGIYSGTSFTINNLIYVAGGCTSGLDSNYQNLWEYDPTNDGWTQKADMPLGGTYGSSAFVINNIGYVVGGWHRTGPGSATSFNFTYSYDPALNAWAAVQSFPAIRYTGVAVELNGKGYMGTGYAPLSKDWWEFDPIANTWTQKANLPGNVRQASHGFSLDGYAYITMGGQYQVNYNDLWQFDPNLNSWAAKANYPDTARSSGSTFVLNNKAYLVGGSNWAGEPFSSIYSYDPSFDKWTFVSFFPGGKRHALITAVANGKAYIGQGSYTDQNTNDYFTANDWWECTIVDANTISGKAFLDFNNNLIMDSGEVECASKIIHELNSGAFTFTRPDGSYELYVTDSGNFSVTTDSIGYFSPVPTSHNVYFSGINQIDSLKDFAFQASTLFRDLSVSITPYGNFRPGFDASYYINYSNLGTNVENPVITLVLDSNLTYLSATETPSYTGNDTVVWALPTINPFQSGSFLVTVNVDATTPIGTTVTSPVVIDPIANDINVYNNYSTWGEVVTGSYDPNDIQVNLAEITTTQLTTQPWLEYLIRFQNTGTDTAFNIDVVNAVPQGVELSSFELISTSHPVVLRHDPVYNLFGFKFNNILLVDSNMNEPLSHGFIRYRIKPQTSLQQGDIIENSAAIYFDFNAPVLTNTALTEIVSPTSVSDFSNGSNQLTVFPNPATKSFYLKLPSGVNSSKLKMISTNGETVFTKSFDNEYTPQGSLAVRLPELSQGIYFVSLITAEGKIFNSKIVIKN
ncbi:MAG TPA: kelch repeat-containing protein [Bacteroidia bacterium]|nr:kelch repeat-containing protein [Bacteroidia bacterium]HNU33867.1 kelch repeat-containing protein [Bacteroidia bacterium]